MTLNLFTKLSSTESRTLLAAILASSMAFIDSSALNVAIPSIQTGLSASGVQVLWMINGYLLTLATFILIGGTLGDKLGRKRVFSIGIGVFLLASIACGISPNSVLFIASRIIQGLGGALMIPGSLSIINANISPACRGQAIGTWSALTTLVMVMGPLLGGVLADAGLWRFIFWINVPIGLLTLFVLSAGVPESFNEAHRGPIDIIGSLLAIAGLGALSYAFLSMPRLGWHHPLIQITLIAGIMASVGFFLWERACAHPMVPFFLFQSRTFLGANLLTLFLYGALSVGLFFATLEMVQAQGYSQSLAGVVFFPFMVLMAALSPKMGGIVDRYGARLPLTIGPLLSGLGFALLGTIFHAYGAIHYWTTFFPGLVVLGLGMSITVAPLTTSVMGSVDKNYSGAASGINNAVSRTAGVLAIAIIGALAIHHFNATVWSGIRGLHLSAALQAQLRLQLNALGAAQVPKGIGGASAALIRAHIRNAFIGACRLVELVCAGLAFLSGMMGYCFIEKKPKPQMVVKQFNV